jgi:hypothetical protein
LKPFVPKTEHGMLKRYSRSVQSAHTGAVLKDE